MLFHLCYRAIASRGKEQLLDNATRYNRAAARGFHLFEEMESLGNQKPSYG